MRSTARQLHHRAVEDGTRAAITILVNRAMPLTHHEVRRHPLWGAAFGGAAEAQIRHDGRAWRILLVLGLVLLLGAVGMLLVLG